MAYVKTLGVEPITGRPGRPTTQGKNERFHQTLFRFLDKQPLAASCEELQAQVDEFDRIYNTERGHQGLPGRITPQQAWDATDVAEPPRPIPAPAEPVVPAGPMQQYSGALSSRSDGMDLSVLFENAAGRQASVTTKDTSTRISGSIHHPGATGAQQLRVYSNGTVSFAGTLFSLTKPLAHRVVIADWDPHRIIFATTVGEVIAEFAWPPPATKYQGITKARYCFQARTTTQLSPIC